MRKLSALILFSIVCGSLYATTYKVPPQNFFKQIYGTNSYTLPSLNALALVEGCGIKGTNGLIQVWNPTEKQILIIDKKVDSKLFSNEKKLTKNSIIKVYFGLSDGLKNKHIYAFVYQKEGYRSLIIGDEQDISVCTRIKTIVDFDLTNLEIKLTETDITNAINRRRKEPHLD